MKAPSPAFSFYPKDWLSDARVQAMTDAEQGLYLRLLCFHWLEGGLPAEPNALRQLLHLSPRRFAQVWPALAPCFQLDGGLLTQKRLVDEKRKQIAHSDHSRTNGLRGGRPPLTTRKDTDHKTQRVMSGFSKHNPEKTFPSPSSLTSSPSEKKGWRASRATWLTPFGNLWKEKFGGKMSFDEAASQLRPLVEEHGSEKVARHFAHYLEVTPERFASVSRFAQKFLAYDPERKPKQEDLPADPERERRLDELFGATGGH